MSITDSLKRRAHVVHYKKDIIPTRSQIEEILRIGYPLATSKQKAFPQPTELSDWCCQVKRSTDQIVGVKYWEERGVIWSVDGKSWRDEEEYSWIEETCRGQPCINILTIVYQS
mgnify:CR=1 FL=1